MADTVHDAIIQRLDKAHEIVIRQVDNAFAVGLSAEVISAVEKAADAIADIIYLIESQKATEG